jgi:hypothetical protein
VIGGASDGANRANTGGTVYRPTPRPLELRGADAVDVGVDRDDEVTPNNSFQIYYPSYIARSGIVLA